jgi:hypothetical protein
VTFIPSTENIDDHTESQLDQRDRRTCWPEIVSLHPQDKLEYFLIHSNLKWRLWAGDVESLPSPIPENGQLIVDE